MSDYAGTEARPAGWQSWLAHELVALGVLAIGLVVFAIAAPVSYAVYLMIHLFAAAVWVGGGAVIAILAFMIDRARDPLLVGRFADMAGKIGIRLFLPSSLIVLIFGFVLVEKGNWGYDDFWVLFGLLGWVVTFGLGIAVIRPLADRVAKVVPERGIEDPEAQRLIRRIVLVDRWQVVLLLLVVADMAAKPFS